MRRALQSILIVGFVCCVVSSLQAQKLVMNNRSEFIFTTGMNLPMGNAVVNGYPTLLGNMSTGASIDVRFLTRITGQLRGGITAGSTRFGNWDDSDSRFLKDSRVEFQSIGLTLNFKQWSPTNFSRNNFNLFAGITSGVSSIDISTTQYSTINEGSTFKPLQVKSIRPFAEVETGAYLNTSNSMAIVAAIGYRHTVADSNVLTDKSFSWMFLKISFALRLARDKHYRLVN